MKITILSLIFLLSTQNAVGQIKKPLLNPQEKMNETSNVSLEEKKNRTSIKETSSSNYVKYNLITENLSHEYMNTNRGGQNEETQHALKINDLLQNDSETNNRIVIGDDDRIEILNPKIQPYLPTAFIKITYLNVFNNITGTYRSRTFEGTGFIVGPDLLLTAGHNVFGDKTKTYYINNEQHSEWEDNIDNPCFPNKIEIFAGANGQTETNAPYVFYCSVLKVNIDKNYYNNCGDFDYDWAILELDRNIGAKTGGYSLVSNTFCFNESSTIYGYPGDKDYVMCESPGKILYSNSKQYVHNMDTSEGNSGSPIFINYNNQMYVCGIHTHWINQNTNGGTIINNLILNIIEYLAIDAKQENIIGSISKTDYGFPDNYTTYIGDSEYYTNHTSSSGFSFQTKRYRTGFIHNECVVMSDIRNGIYSAFLTYHFYEPITKIEVDLSHWRELTHEWTYSTETTCILRVGTHIVANLLSDEINLSTNRNSPTKYTFLMLNPTDVLRFEMNAVVSHSNVDNRGRVCIGNINVYNETN